ncbi:hypothetical protein NA56DRAFT_751428 [Hyaloscypha hepaticicola]|uniref:Uncharacterized protein n=1 Tax=Hyaloscypha hepaticicola TaxID=2082293 RepID=A0A2J6PWR8_9HELO|nr:hypothetical protein NA56DRAFT_751428 [Hyaloscypha hepaticicola]
MRGFKKDVVGICDAVSEDDLKERHGWKMGEKQDTKEDHQSEKKEDEGEQESRPEKLDRDV